VPWDAGRLGLRRHGPWSRLTGVPLVTEIRLPTLAVLFNENSGPEQVAELISRQHAFVEYEAYDTTDEEGRAAYLLLVYCETATADQLYDLIGNRLPDYVLARRFPTSRVEDIRTAAG
jgi:hypothetical protein